MTSLINSISLQWDLWIEQYRAFFPSGKEDRQACLALFPKDQVPQLPDNALMAACQDTHSGEIIACLFLMDALTIKEQDGGQEQYQLDLFDQKRLGQLAVISRLAFHPEHQQSAAGIVLLSLCFTEVLKAGGEAMLLSADPAHYSMFKRIGFRPIAPLRKMEDDHYQIPMICLPDQDYLSIIHSPVLPLMRGIDFEAYRSICRWYYQLVRENRELQIGSALYSDEEGGFERHHTITDGLSVAGRDALLHNAIIIRCREGEVLIHENDGGKAFGYVRQGLVRVVIGNKTIVLLGEGDIFGEIAFILHTKRSAQVVAASDDTEVVLFREAAINDLEQEADRTAIWRNLARVLAQRVTLTNKLLGEAEAR